MWGAIAEVLPAQCCADGGCVDDGPGFANRVGVGEPGAEGRCCAQPSMVVVEAHGKGATGIAAPFPREPWPPKICPAAMATDVPLPHLVRVGNESRDVRPHASITLAT